VEKYGFSSLVLKISAGLQYGQKIQTLLFFFGVSGKGASQCSRNFFLYARLSLKDKELTAILTPP